MDAGPFDPQRVTMTHWGVSLPSPNSTPPPSPTPAPQPNNNLLVGFPHGRRHLQPPMSHKDSLGGFSATSHLHTTTPHPLPRSPLPCPSTHQTCPTTHQLFVGGFASRTPALTTPNKSQRLVGGFLSLLPPPPTKPAQQPTNLSLVGFHHR